MIARHGTDEQKQRLLPKLAIGEWRTGIGLTEPGAGTDLQGISTTARRDGDEYVVNGTKTWITNARHADVLPVLVKTDPSATPPHKGMSMLLIDTSTPGHTARWHTAPCRANQVSVQPPRSAMRVGALALTLPI